MAFIDLILLRVCRACSIGQFMSFTKFGKLWGFISSNIFPSLFLLSFRTPVIPLRESPALLLGLHPEATWIHMGAGLQPRCSDGEGAGLWGPAVMAVGFSGAPSNWEIFLPLIAVSFGAPVPSWCLWPWAATCPSLCLSFSIWSHSANQVGAAGSPPWWAQTWICSPSWPARAQDPKNAPFQLHDAFSTKQKKKNH